MKRGIALAFLLLFTANLAIESAEACGTEDVNCCVCLCQAPGAVTPHITAAVVLAPKQFVAFPDAIDAERVFDKSLFHPPRLLP